MMWNRVLQLFFLAVSVPVAAQPSDSNSNLRGALVQGLDGTVLASYICGDFGLSHGFSLVGCGAASDLFSNSLGAAELSHYRIEWSRSLIGGRTEVVGIVGAGMAEAQLGEDRVGFYFLPAEDGVSVEAAGAELMLGVEAFVPTLIRLNHFHLRLDVGVAWLPGWKKVGGTSQDLVGFSVLTANAFF